MACPYEAIATSTDCQVFLKLGGNCFTVLCWFLLYNNANQLWLYNLMYLQVGGRVYFLALTIIVI